MAYNRENYKKRVRFVLGIYEEHKKDEVPDTHIVRNIFPKYGVAMSYRMWMIIKGLKPSQYN